MLFGNVTNLDIQFVLMKSMYLDFGDAEVKVEGLLRQPEGREPIPVKKEEK
ncbi:hypothetical protein NXW20_17995 [Bacteroides faecis]|uniref:hypothetical protein n=1 Tax=Bacteroides faecis TaxID=674529 RepID=UPI0002F2BE70|nr:hypothetical protein [Bacteroides faecis]MCB6631721.1 hypothetical protein [Bacteroides faecis]MCS2197376.1 hypothetical protein [Bacteroides faecis]MCS2236413.1 hypothetical protein [Bacteroides faecis]MCS2549343.1 hypothetical protein [Bacteroides faecis]MCS2653291.1 hypothetical protein [Bacteroides faecis]